MFIDPQPWMIIILLVNLPSRNYVRRCSNIGGITTTVDAAGGSAPCQRLNFNLDVSHLSRKNMESQEGTSALIES